MANDLMTQPPRSVGVAPRSELFYSVAFPLLNGADRSTDGRTIIGRKLTDPEREIIVARRDEVARVLVNAEPDDVKRNVRNMMVGMDVPWATEKEAMVVLAQYEYAMRGLPLFAIASACGRFSRGEVSAEELGERYLSKRKPPSTAHLRIVALAIAQPYRNDAAAARALLNAMIAPPEPTPEQRERGTKILHDVGEMLRAKTIELDTAESHKRAKAQAELKSMGEKSLLREYASAGVDPVYSPDGTLVSLSLMVSRGYKIQRVGHENVLVAPPPAAPYKPKEREST